jgi:hypothetical protein
VLKPARYLSAALLDPISSFQPLKTFGKLGHLVECVPGD